jgi:hypothetical protein
MNARKAPGDDRIALVFSGPGCLRSSAHKYFATCSRYIFRSAAYVFGVGKRRQLSDFEDFGRQVNAEKIKRVSAHVNFCGQSNSLPSLNRCNRYFRYGFLDFDCIC